MLVRQRQVSMDRYNCESLILTTANISSTITYLVLEYHGWETSVFMVVCITLYKLIYLIVHVYGRIELTEPHFIVRDVEIPSLG